MKLHHITIAAALAIGCASAHAGGNALSATAKQFCLNESRLARMVAIQRDRGMTRSVMLARISKVDVPQEKKEFMRDMVVILYEAPQETPEALEAMWLMACLAKALQEEGKL